MRHVWGEDLLYQMHLKQIKRNNKHKALFTIMLTLQCMSNVCHAHIS